MRLLLQDIYRIIKGILMRLLLQDIYRIIKGISLGSVCVRVAVGAAQVVEAA